MRSLLLLSLFPLLGGCVAIIETDERVVRRGDALPANDSLLGTLWVQSAAEYEALSLQTFATAERMLDRALADPAWTAAVEQVGQDFAALPPAIIVDVDETVLDNSPNQARLIRDREVYSEETWAAWVRTEEARALPGAVAFLRTAAERGVTVFYVTNRQDTLKEATRRNLLAEGFPVDDAREVLLLKGENGWTSDKTARRELIAADYRVIMLFGDDLNDFVPARTKTPEPRRGLVADHAAAWGERWFMLPNPIYGSWEASLFGRDYSLDEDAIRARRHAHLEPFELP